MKKRIYIVPAMAVAMAAFVGCQKEIDPVAGLENANSTVERPVIGSVELMAGDVATRVTLGGNSGTRADWEDGDKLGAALVDEVKKDPQKGYFVQGENDFGTWTYAEYVTGVTNPFDGEDYLFTQTYVSPDENADLHTGQAFYERTQNIWTNYPYEHKGGSFTSQAELVEGHYVFYAPYNAGNGTRGPLMATLPVEQTITPSATKPEESHSAVEELFNGEAPAVLDIRYLSASMTTEPKVSLQHLYAYPEFTIRNEFNGFLFDGKTKSGSVFISTATAKTYTMKVKQIELYPGDQSNTGKDIFAYKRAINVNKLYDATLIKDSDEKDAEKRWYYTQADKNYLMATTADVLDADDNGYNKTEFAFEDNKVYFEGDVVAPITKEGQRIVLKFEDVVLAPNGGEFKFNAVVPAADYIECGLYARILVEIDGVEYYIMTGDVKVNTPNAQTSSIASVRSATAATYKSYAEYSSTTVNDYRILDRKNNGSKDIVLVRGQRYPKAEMNENQSTGPKTHAGSALTIVLKGGTSEVGFAKYVEVPGENPADKGIFDNAGFKAAVNRINSTAPLAQTWDVTLVKNEDEEIDGSVNLFKLKVNNDVVLNADLIAFLQNSQEFQSITFAENLPIGDDVVVTPTENDNEFLFTTADGLHEFTIKYNFDEAEEYIKLAKEIDEDVDTAKYEGFGKDGAKLVEGINVIDESLAEGKSLTAGEGVKNAIVFLETSATIKNAKGISKIAIVAKDVTLTVDATAGVASQIVAEASSKIVITKGNLTNTANDFNGAAIVNNTAATVKGENVGVVSYESVGFPATALPAESQINKVTIKANVDKTTAEFPVTSADVAKYEALTDVTYIFTKQFVKGFVSNEDITFENAVQVIYEGETPAKWNGKSQSVVNPVTIKSTCKNVADPAFVNFLPAGDVVLVLSENQSVKADMVFDAEALEAAEGNITLGADIEAAKTVALDEGATFDGNGFALTSGAANGITATSGEIKNVAVSGASGKNIYASLAGDLVMTGVVSGSEEDTASYAFNVDGNGNLTVTDSYFYGWSSWSVGPDNTENTVTFTGCTFGASDTPATIAPWNTTKFVNCEFEKGLHWLLDAHDVNGAPRINYTAGERIILVNCTVGGKEITEAMFSGLGTATDNGSGSRVYTTDNFKFSVEQSEYDKNVRIKDIFVVNPKE